MASPHSRQPLKWYAYSWLFFCTVLFCLPGNAFPETKLVNIPYFDKWIHISLFAVLSFLFIKAFEPAGPKSLIGLLSALIGYGLLIEIVQLYLVPFRSFDLVDILADAIGVSIGLLVVWRSMSINEGKANR